MKQEGFLEKVGNILDLIYSYLNHVIFIVSIIGVILNVFHLLVLSRKSMRKLTINIFMAGIAICDFAHMISFVIALTPDFYTAYKDTKGPDYCSPPQSYFVYKLIDTSVFILNASPKLAVWLGVSLATLRAVVIKHPTNPRIQSLTNSRHGKRILLAICLPHICYFTFEYNVPLSMVTQVWTPPPQCVENSKNNTFMLYYTDFDPLWFKVSILVDGIIFKLVPSILLPFFTIVLLCELKKMKKVAASKSFHTLKNKSRSTKLVTFVTITFLISTAPLGILYIVDYIQLQAFASLTLISKLESIFILISIINGTLHFLICFFMSSQYRNTVKNAVGWNSKIKNLAVTGASIS